MYLPNSYSACSASGCTLTAPQEPVLAGSAVLVSGENPPLPGGATTRFAITGTVSNPGTTAITNVQITVPLAAGTTFVSQTSTIDGAAAACTSAPAAGYRRCTFATLAAGSYASLVIEVDYQPAATGLQDLTAAPANPTTNANAVGPVHARVAVGARSRARRRSGRSASCR